MSSFRAVVIISFILFSLLQVSFGQTVEERGLELKRLAAESKKFHQEQSRRAREYAEKHNVPLVHTDSRGNVIMLVGVDNDGLPLYKATDNAGAATTTGVTKLREGGVLGLNLEGDGMVVGVWDGGIVGSHLEFGSRLLQTEGTNSSDHATHVTGTIIASGVNSSAKGMAPKASALTWDFGNDEPEMIAQAKPDQTTLLISNHSYGLITGWRFEGGWQWFGNAGISTTEDYRFGFYSSAARQWDQIAFNAPYYTICKSAGNDRNEVGSGAAGASPPDCNGGAGFDCVGDVSTAKNIILVGAVNKVTNYVNASSVTMSNFSSWGPTDDGRIKPDIVAAGVNLFSTVGTTNYGSLSGTSMATPNATGSLVLLQELHKTLTGNFMRSATLKALAIHSSKECGPNPGPDYMFGWGLLDVEAAAKLLLGNDNQNVIIREETLSNHGVFELALNPVADTKIKVTVVWTDPAGTPVAPSLDPTNRMLVNDLDVRIVDDNEQERTPWILDPADPNAAATFGDNIRDNVEKIEFSNPEPRPYKVRVSHKGDLVNLEQKFSIIVEYTSTNDPSIAYYWVGGSGDWSNTAHWSLASGGPPAGVVPGASDRVFFDENSFTGSSEVTLSNDQACSSMVWFSDDAVSVDLNGHSLSIRGNLVASSSSLSAVDGKIEFTGEVFEENLISLNGNSLLVDLEFNGDSDWALQGSADLGSVKLVNGDITVSGQDWVMKGLISVGTDSRRLVISNSTISGIENSVLESTGLVLNSSNSMIITDSSLPVVINWNGVDFNGELKITGSDASLIGSCTISKMTVDGSVEILGNNVIGTLVVNQGSIIQLGAGTEQVLSTETEFSSSPENPIQLMSTGPGVATLNFDGHFKLCFDNLEITNVDIVGEATINAGLNSTVVDSENWMEQDCSAVLFANFEISELCAGSLVEFNNLSEGEITEWSWDFGDPGSASNESDQENTRHVYEDEGDYTVSLTISNDGDEKTYEKLIHIGPNDLSENHVVLSNSRLFSFQAASSYQWYKNNEPIEGEIARGFDFEGEEGLYFVVTKNNGCNRASSPYLITDVYDEETLSQQVSVFPNPAKDIMHIEIPPSQNLVEAALYDSFGRIVGNFIAEGHSISFSVNSYSSGVYFLHIATDKIRVMRKVAITKQ